MEKITKIKGFTAPFDREDVDTDLILPAQYMTSISRGGYKVNLFRRLRDTQADFFINQEKFNKATILVAGDNFGCGSSREHAVWALKEYGFEAILAPSFADIFATNCSKNGLVLIELSKEIISSLLANSIDGDFNLEISIETQEIKTSLNDCYKFELDSFLKHRLLSGQDDLAYILDSKAQIDAHFKTYPSFFSSLKENN
jgi:3-isopropylmalate/(R)-2-methylmalate dehydratase small subunit